MDPRVHNLVGRAIIQTITHIIIIIIIIMNEYD